MHWFWLLQFLPKGILNYLETKTYLHKLVQDCCFLDFCFMHSLQEVLLVGFDVNLSSINEKWVPNENSKGMILISFLVNLAYGFLSKQYKKQVHKIIALKKKKGKKKGKKACNAFRDYI